MKKPKDLSMASPEYRQFIEELKGRVLSARISAARSINRDLILLYWDIGRGIVEKQKILDWGNAVIERISADLQDAFTALPSLNLLTRFGSLIKGRHMEIKSVYPLDTASSIWFNSRQPPTAKRGISPKTGLITLVASML